MCKVCDAGDAAEPLIEAVRKVVGDADPYVAGHALMAALFHLAARGREGRDAVMMATDHARTGAMALSLADRFSEALRDVEAEDRAKPPAGSGLH